MEFIFCLSSGNSWGPSVPSTIYADTTATLMDVHVGRVVEISGSKIKSNKCSAWCPILCKLFLASRVYPEEGASLSEIIVR